MTGYNSILVNMEPATWRLILTSPAEGSWNMAVDETLLEGMGKDDSLPVLRLYAWEPACLSLGYAQPFADLDLGAIQQKGWTYVRRPTGGRAILHTDELTYSVIAPLKEPRVAGTILESYQRLSQALMDALRLLGLPARADREYETTDKQKSANPICFEVPSNYEITVNGKKLIGSAQARRREGVLQHGSLPLYGQLDRITLGLVFPDETSRQEAAARLPDRATTVAAVIGRVVSWSEAAQAFEIAFQGKLNIDFVSSELSANELSRADQLVVEKYGNDSWNQRI